VVNKKKELDLDALRAEVVKITDDETLPHHLKEGYVQIRDGIDQIKRDKAVHELLTKGRNTLEK